jgi:hypothetical protein
MAQAARLDWLFGVVAHDNSTPFSTRCAEMVKTENALPSKSTAK